MPRKDVNQLAAGIVNRLTAEEAEPAKSSPDTAQSKGGKARASKLPAKRRKEIARRAAQARWAKG